MATNEVNKSLTSDDASIISSELNDKVAEETSTELDENETKEKDLNTENTLTNDGKEIREASCDNDKDASTTVDYEKFLTYNENGVAIYTDPTTKCQFEFDNEQNKWVPFSDAKKAGNEKVTKSEDPYENEHYRWCHETNQWIPKGSNTTVAENEYYKWDSESNKWIPKEPTGDGSKTYTDSDGTVFFWDEEKNAWFPKIDDEFMANYQLSYGFIDNTSDEKDSKKIDEKPEKSIVQDSTESEIKNVSNKRKQPEWFDLPKEANTKVYVDNLPDDITEPEFIDLMSKCGMILKDPSSGKHKIKLYAEPSGQLKGDGLCHYIRVESVQLALNLLDGYDFRGRKLKVQRAQFQMRGQYNPALKPKKKKADKEKLKKMQEKLLDWRPEKMRGERSKHERIVIIKNLFTPELFEKEVHLIIDYQKDLREECTKCGTVRKVVIYDRHPEGVAQINMADPDEADLIVQMMNKRYFGKRQLIAEIWDGKTRYKVEETGTEEDKRLTNWDQFLQDDEESATKTEAIKTSNA